LLSAKTPSVLFQQPAGQSVPHCEVRTSHTSERAAHTFKVCAAPRIPSGAQVMNAPRLVDRTASLRSYFGFALEGGGQGHLAPSTPRGLCPHWPVPPQTAGADLSTASYQHVTASLLAVREVCRGAPVHAPWRVLVGVKSTACGALAAHCGTDCTVSATDQRLQPSKTEQIGSASANITSADRLGVRQSSAPALPECSDIHFK
jgi:hypothetical protein